MTIAFRLAEPHESHPISCGARRSRRGQVNCSMPALHHNHPVFHAGRDRLGRWHFWTTSCAVNQPITSMDGVAP